MNSKKNRLIDVSVVIPAYNCSDSIEPAIDSVLEQKGVNLEIIVVDDCSQDDTKERAEKYGHNVVVFSTENNQGPGAARNKGIIRAKGEYIAFLDADDRWLPDKIKKQLSIMQKNSELALISTGAKYLSPEGELRYTSKLKLEGELFHRLLRGNCIVTSSVMVRAEKIKSLGEYFNSKMRVAEDWALWIKMAARFPISIIPDVLVEYRMPRPDKYEPRQFEYPYMLVWEMMKNDEFCAPKVKNRAAWWKSNMHYTLAAMYRKKGRWRQMIWETYLGFKHDPKNLKPLIRLILKPLVSPV